MTRLLHEWPARAAERDPDATALVMGDERLSYGELESLANRIARQLIAAGCLRGDRVCMLLPKAPSTIAAMLGALKAGCAYVPMDTDSPPARQAKIVRSCEPRVVLATVRAAGALGEEIDREGPTRPERVGLLDDGDVETSGVEVAFDPAAVAAEADSPPDAAPSELAHILFTSGSTGTPKGVMVTHESVAAFVEWAVGYFGITPTDRVACHSPLHFDLSTFDLYGAFAAGARVHLVPAKLSLLPNKLAALIRDAQLTQWFSVPSLLSYMARFDVVAFGDFPELKRVLWCGEVFPTPALIHWMKRLPHARFTNLYGPTEAAIASSYYTVESCPVSESEDVPIGLACPGEELMVLDEDLNPSPPDEAGHLYIGGVGLSPGYWKDPEKTEAAFIRGAPGRPAGERIYATGDLARVGRDGLIHFIGRADTQIKSRGYRIELGEIETALSAIPSIRESVVVAVDSEGFEGKVICCAYVASAAPAMPPREVRRELARTLPSYMLPTRWLTLDELPRNTNGKIDRRELRLRFEREMQPREAGTT